VGVNPRVRLRFIAAADTCSLRFAGRKVLERLTSACLPFCDRISADGEVEDIQINKSSGSKILDEAAKRIVRLSAPFYRFPDDVKRDLDILHITRTWMFTWGDTLSAE